MLERFEQKFIPEPMSGCWLWVGAAKTHGYGAFWYGGRLHGAHRASYEMNVGPIPKGAVVRHTCDNPPCVNPAHLRLGTAQDNTNDSVKRGRNQKGERNGRVKLTEDEVVEIRRRRAAGESQDSIAAAFCITQSSVSEITSGKTWRSTIGPLSTGMYVCSAPK